MQQSVNTFTVYDRHMNRQATKSEISAHPHAVLLLSICKPQLNVMKGLCICSFRVSVKHEGQVLCAHDGQGNGHYLSACVRA